MYRENEKLMPLLKEAEQLHARLVLSQTVTADYYEPGMMEYLDQSEGLLDEENGRILLRFEAKGTRYEGRTEQIEKVKVGEPVQIVREEDNPYNPNNFTILSKTGSNLGNVPATLCNALAQVYDEGIVTIQRAKVSFVEPISIRNRHAKQAVLFVEIVLEIMK